MKRGGEGEEERVGGRYWCFGRGQCSRIFLGKGWKGQRNKKVGKSERWWSVCGHSIIRIVEMVTVIDTGERH